jgi:hypothetical protein
MCHCGDSNQNGSIEQQVTNTMVFHYYFSTHNDISQGDAPAMLDILNHRGLI